MDYQPLPQTKINDIEAKTSEILRSIYGDTDNIALPVPIFDIIKQFHIDLRTGELPDKSVSGMYSKSDRTIIFAKDEPFERQTFTIAHELGHYVLHDKKQLDVFYRMEILKLTDETREQEKEANWFAAALLIPEKSLRHYYAITHDLDDLATLFGVSVTAIYYRLKNLGLMQ
jgi:Zn-dependent peptidase ImmA (M78 family)